MAKNKEKKFRLFDGDEIGDGVLIIGGGILLAYGIFFLARLL